MFDTKWDPTFENTDGNDYTCLKRLSINQSLGDLRNISEQMLRIMDFENKGIEAPVNETDGKRASLSSPGNIPFMLVYSDQKRLVYFRRNVELISCRNTKAVHIPNNFENMRVHELPLFVTDKGRPVPGYLRKQTLREIIPDNGIHGWIHCSSRRKFDFPRNKLVNIRSKRSACFCQGAKYNYRSVLD